MNKLITILLLAVLSSCNQEYEVVSTEVVKGFVSAKEEAVTGGYGRPYTPARIYIQTPILTKQIKLPHKFKDEYNIGDTAILIIQTIKEKHE
jgi:hypothetical protein